MRQSGFSPPHPAPLSPGRRVGAYLDMLFVDHGIFRLAYLNLHRLGDRAWRSAQPTPHQIRALGRRGVRTIVNLRGERRCGSYFLEREACARYGIELVDFHMRSRKAPTREHIAAAVKLFDRIEYPMLMHCKSGADRTGLMSALYLFSREAVPLAEAKRQLSPLYGYFKWTRAGILDAFFERYLKSHENRSMPFLQWVERIYDPEQLTRSYRLQESDGCRHRAT
jgi:protein tyrosine/serine phosphatase